MAIVSGQIVHGTEKEGTYVKCEVNDNDRWVIEGVTDGLEVICIFNVEVLVSSPTQYRVVNLTVDGYFHEITLFYSSSVAINDGTHVSGTYLDTYSQNNVYYKVNHGAADDEIDIQFSFVLSSNRTPKKISFEGRYLAANGGQVGIYAYNYVEGTWDSIGSLSSTTGDQTKECNLVGNHINDEWETLIRFATTEGTIGDELRVDFLELDSTPVVSKVEIYAYNYETSSYDKLGEGCNPIRMTHSTCDVTNRFQLDLAYRDANERATIRFLAVSGDQTNNELHLDYATATI